MGRLLQLKRYAWLIIGFQFLVSFLMSISLINEFLTRPDLASPLLPEYAKYIIYISHFLTTSPVIIIFIGIILIVLKKKSGWIISLGALFWYTLTLLRMLGVDGVSTIVAVVFLLIEVPTIIVLLQEQIRSQLNIKRPDFIYTVFIPLVFLLIDLNRMPLSVLLSRWFN